MVIVILCGGNGTRLWPASRQQKPKQFLRLFGTESLIVQTARRALAAHAEKIYILTNADQAALANAEMEEAGIDAEILTEPAQRNTGPAIAFATAQLAARGVTEPVVFLPADHYIQDADRFLACVDAAAHTATRHDLLVVLGKRPDRPETGYGYIERGDKLTEHAFAVRRFVEKPDEPTAMRYLAQGHYWWNTGLLVARPQVILEELREHVPAMAAAVLGTVGAASRYHEAENLSFDYAVLERSSRVAVVEAAFSWSDIGNWASWAEKASGKGISNACNSDAELIALAAKNNAVWSEKTVVLQDVDDLIIIDTPEALYITRKTSAPKTGQARAAALELNPSLR